jgi:hypothetical protein
VGWGGAGRFLRGAALRTELMPARSTNSLGETNSNIASELAIPGVRRRPAVSRSRSARRA